MQWAVPTPACLPYLSVRSVCLAFQLVYDSFGNLVTHEKSQVGGGVDLKMHKSVRKLAGGLNTISGFPQSLWIFHFPYSLPPLECHAWRTKGNRCLGPLLLGARGDMRINTFVSPIVRLSLCHFHLFFVPFSHARTSELEYYLDIPLGYISL